MPSQDNQGRKLRHIVSIVANLPITGVKGYYPAPDERAFEDSSFHPEWPIRELRPILWVSLTRDFPSERQGTAGFIEPLGKIYYQ
jgi:hypothetical protein